jgi:hypothetical protein
MFHRQNDRIWPPDTIINSSYLTHPSPVTPLSKEIGMEWSTLEKYSILQLWILIF